MPCRGIRGAITVSENNPEEILAATEELLRALCAANNLEAADIASAIFTLTPDLDAAFPAQAARRMGWDHVPLLDSTEIGVPGSLPRCIRVLVNWNTELPSYAIRHVYLREAIGMRPDLQIDAPEASPHTSQAHDVSENVVSEQARTSDWRGTNGGLPLTVAYQGEPGAYSQEAIFQHFGPTVDSLACHTFDQIFGAVEAGDAHAGLLPVENSQAGSINQAFDLLLDHDLRVTGEVKLRVRHCLLAPPGTSLGEVRRVRSHPQALAQCERYIRSRGWEALPAYDTAGAARELAGKPEAGTAAIASALAGQTYGLENLASGIEDSADNTTRFFLLGREEPPPGRYNKTSLVFATLHTPGALYNALGELASRGINLTKIESRPRRNRPWHYVFYVDLEGHWQDAAIHRALIGLLARTAFVKLLGSYPAATEARNGE
jgi:prephenate dehydratase